MTCNQTASAINGFNYIKPTYGYSRGKKDVKSENRNSVYKATTNDPELQRRFETASFCHPEKSDESDNESDNESGATNRKRRNDTSGKLTESCPSAGSSENDKQTEKAVAARSELNINPERRLSPPDDEVQCRRNSLDMSDDPLTIAILKMGCDRDSVKKAIECRLRTGRAFEDINQLLDAVMHMESSGGNELHQKTTEKIDMLSSLFSAPSLSSTSTSSLPISLPSSSSFAHIHTSKTATPTVVITAHKAAPSLEHLDAERILEENSRFKEQRTCIICTESERNITLVPCGHLVLCASCSFGCKDCPICRQKISKTIRISRS